MNILNKENKSLAPNFGSSTSFSLKRNKFSWAEPCNPGRFEMIAKKDLNIDGLYQRHEVSKSKVMEIAREWDWKLFGTLSVVKRSDGTFWIYDGGHRCRASFLRDDILELPCLVFDVDDTKTEAKAFLGTNVMKSAVSAYHKHKAAVVIQEPLALIVQKIVEKHGYYIAEANGCHAFVAIHTLHKIAKEDASLADRVFGACAAIAQDGETFSGEMLGAIFYCQKRLSGGIDILSNGYLERLVRETVPGIEAAMRREKHIVGKGGFTVTSKAVLDILNKGKRTRISF